MAEPIEQCKKKNVETKEHNFCKAADSSFVQVALSCGSRALGLRIDLVEVVVALLFINQS